MPFGVPMHQREGAAKMKLEKDYIVSVFIMCYCATAQIFVLQLKYQFLFYCDALLHNHSSSHTFIILEATQKFGS
jgi:hypothetical protein